MKLFLIKIKHKQYMLLETKTYKLFKYNIIFSYLGII